MSKPDPTTIDSLPIEMIEAIRHDAERFPDYVQGRGREYYQWARVGPLEIEPDVVRATVRGTRNYRTAWRWNGSDVDPLCSCPVGPLCKHAYALACAILVARGDSTRASFATGGPAGTRPAFEAKARRSGRDQEIEDLRRGSPMARGPALARVLWHGHGRGVYLSPYEFGDILEDPDPDLMCWRLAQEISRRANGWVPRGLAPYRDRPELAARVAEREQTAMADNLTLWAKRHAAAPTRSLRVLFGLDRDANGSPVVTIEVRLTSPRLRDEPRSAQQLIQLASDLRQNSSLLAPPHARLLRVLAGTLPNAMRHEHGTRFELGTTSLNRLLDGMADSAAVTWGESVDQDLRERTGIVPGDRIRLGETLLDVLPVCVNDADGMRVALAARWRDDHERLLDHVVFLGAGDDLHPSLVLAEGAFWRVGEEPPRHLLERFRHAGSLPVPETGRESFLGLLASSFSSVADALAPHTRLHPARPVVALDLRDNDWLQVRLFAHAGTDDWRPGMTPVGAVFEFAPESRWIRVRDDGGSRAVGIEAGIPDELATIDALPGTSAPEEDTIAAEAVTPAPVPTDVWLEIPDPAHVASARQWLESLPLARGDVRGRGGTWPDHPDAHVGWWMRMNAANLESFAEAWESRPTDVAWLGNQGMRALLAGSRAVRPAIHVTPSGVDLFSVSAEWEAEGLQLTEDDLAKLRTARTRFVKLRGGWVHRELADAYDAAADVLADLGIDAGAEPQSLSIWQLAQARPESLAVLGELGADAAAFAAIERLRERVRAFRGLPRIDLPGGLKGELRPYQRDGFDFLVFVTGLGMGAVLADDMGLGKTVQALTWLEHLRENDPRGGPTLVVCPASVVHNWQRESERFTPGLRVLALVSGEARHALRREIPDHDLVITNYALLRRDIEQWKEVPLRAAILDEAQFIKNPDSAISRAVLKLDARHRVALTGTPLENRALDLWSIMRFLNPGYLGNRSNFVARYDRPDAPPHTRRLLAAKLRPVLLRRLKSQVARDLPDRIEERRDCELTRGQRQLYLDELLRVRQSMRTLAATPEGMQRHKFEILAGLTRLRQICCHPALVGGKLAVRSGKFEALFELLEPLLAEGQKVLVFSQFVECLKLLEEDMRHRGIRHHLLTGATVRREEVVAAFENDPEPCVFLISLKAGGTGLNLTAASYVVLFDPWWNPAVEAQAIDRTHRIGQTRTVIAFRMLAQGTIEEKIWELQARKAALARDVLGEDGFARTLTRSDLDYLLAEEVSSEP